MAVGAVPARPEPSTGFLARVLAAASLVQTTVSLPIQALPALAPLVTAHFGLTRAEFGLYPSAFYIGSVIATTLWGNLADRGGVRAMYAAGLLIAAVSAVASALAPNFPVFLLVLAVGGVGGGIAWPASSRGIIEWFVGPRLGAVMSVKQVGYAVAGSINGLTLPALAGAIGWQLTLIVLAGIVALSAVPAYLWHQDRPAGRAPGPRAAPGNDPRPTGGVDGPPGNLLRHPGILRACISSFLSGGVQQVALGFLALFLGERAGLDVAAAGGLLALMQAVGAASRIGWGIVSDTVFRGRRQPALIGVSLLGTAAVAALALVGPATPGWLLALLIVLLGCGTIGWNGVNYALIGELSGRARSAEAAGLGLSSSNLGIIVMPPLFGLAVDLAGSYTAAYAVLAALLLLNVALLLTLRER